MLYAQVSVQAIDLIDLGLELQTEANLLAEGLLGSVVLLHQHCLLVVEVAVILPEFLHLPEDLIILGLVQLFITLDYILLALDLPGELSNLR
jgi:hypothetical protein